MAASATAVVAVCWHYTVLPHKTLVSHRHTHMLTHTLGCVFKTKWLWLVGDTRTEAFTFHAGFKCTRSRNTSFHKVINIIKWEPEPRIETQMCWVLVRPQNQNHYGDTIVKRLSQLVRMWKDWMRWGDMWVCYTPHPKVVDANFLRTLQLPSVEKTFRQKNGITPLQKLVAIQKRGKLKLYLHFNCC